MKRIGSFTWRIGFCLILIAFSLRAKAENWEPDHSLRPRPDGPGMESLGKPFSSDAFFTSQPDKVSGANLQVFNMDGTAAFGHTWRVEATESQATDLGTVEWPATLSPVHFVKLPENWLTCPAN